MKKLTQEEIEPLYQWESTGDPASPIIALIATSSGLGQGDIQGKIAALVAAGTGYYMYKNYKEDQIYDETLSEQPTSGGYSNGRMMQQTMQPTMGYSSYKRDSLATAGVVGGLDRNKIGHHKMGSNKNSHLFGG